MSIRYSNTFWQNHLARPIVAQGYYNVGKYLYQKTMAPVKRGYSKMRGPYAQSRYEPYKKQKKMTKGKKYVSDSGGKKERSISGYSASFGLGAKKTYRKKGLHSKKPPKVSVSKMFKAKVEKSLAAGEIFGSVRTLDATDALGVAAAVNSQRVVYLSPSIGPSSPFGMDWLFTTDQFLHWASVLFNGKTVALPTSTTQMLGAGGVRTVGNFNPENLFCTIKSCSMEYKFKNHAQNGCKLAIHQLKPKSVGSMVPGLNVAYGFNLVSNTNVARNGVISIPETDWNESISDEIRSKTQLNTGLSTQSVGLEPKMNKNFVQKYAIETTYMILEAGQSQNYFVAGPSQLVLDYAKFCNDDIHQNIQKFSRGFIVTVEWLPAITYTAAGAATGVFGRQAPLTNTNILPLVTPASVGVTCEREFHLTMAVPPGTDANTDRTSRKRVDLTTYPTPLSVPAYRNPENPDDFTSGALP